MTQDEKVALKYHGYSLNELLEEEKYLINIIKRFEELIPHLLSATLAKSYERVRSTHEKELIFVRAGIERLNKANVDYEDGTWV